MADMSVCEEAATTLRSGQRTRLKRVKVWQLWAVLRHWEHGRWSERSGLTSFPPSSSFFHSNLAIARIGVSGTTLLPVCLAAAFSALHSLLCSFQSTVWQAWEEEGQRNEGWKDKTEGENRTAEQY